MLSRRKPLRAVHFSLVSCVEQPFAGAFFLEVAVYRISHLHDFAAPVKQCANLRGYAPGVGERGRTTPSQNNTVWRPNSPKNDMRKRPNPGYWRCGRENLKALDE